MIAACLHFDSLIFSRSLVACSAGVRHRVGPVLALATCFVSSTSVLTGADHVGASRGHTKNFTVYVILLNA